MRLEEWIYEVDPVLHEQLQLLTLRAPSQGKHTGSGRLVVKLVLTLANIGDEFYHMRSLELLVPVAFVKLK